MTVNLGRYDIVILGGGPAGCAAGIDLAKRGFSVAILERSNYAGLRHGEMLPPDAAYPLQRLGVWNEFLLAGHLESPGVVSSWSSSQLMDNDFISHPLGNGWHLDRPVFDEMLATAALRVGVSVFRETQATAVHQDVRDGWSIRVSRQGVPDDLGASFLIDATGRAAWLTRRLGVPRHNLDQLVGVVGVVENSARTDARLLLEAFPNGWWYTAVLPTGLMIAACMTDADYLPHHRDELTEGWHANLESAPQTRSAIGEQTRVRTMKTVFANSARSAAVCGPGWIAIGDAAMAFDPLSARGIMKSLESGLEAAAAIESIIRKQSDTFSDYSAWNDREADTYLQNYRLSYEQVSRWPNSRFWQRRQSHLGSVAEPFESVLS